jgi:hypothetical protein
MQAELKLVFDDMDELHQWLYKFNGSSAGPVQAATSDTAQPGDAAAPAEVPAPVRRVRGPNKPKPAICAAQPAAPQGEPAAAAPAPVQTEPAVAAGYADMTPVIQAAIDADCAPPAASALRALFGKVNEKHGAGGLAKVSEIVQQFGVQRIAELKPEQYAAAAKACEAALA